MKKRILLIVTLAILAVASFAFSRVDFSPEPDQTEACVTKPSCCQP